MSDTIAVIFSGGPANNMVYAIHDCREWRFPIQPNLDWSDISTVDFDKPFPIHEAIYRRTNALDRDGNRIFEFCGIFPEPERG